MLGRCPGSAAVVMTVPVRSPLPSSVRCPATASSSGTTSGELVGVRGDGALTDDNPFAVPERGEQPDLASASRSAIGLREANARCPRLLSGCPHGFARMRRHHSEGPLPPLSLIHISEPTRPY